MLRDVWGFVFTCWQLSPKSFKNCSQVSGQYCWSFSKFSLQFRFEGKQRNFGQLWATEWDYRSMTMCRATPLLRGFSFCFALLVCASHAVREKSIFFLLFWTAQSSVTVGLICRFCPHKKTVLQIPWCRPNSHRTRTPNTSKWDLLLSMGCSHCLQATSEEKRSNLCARCIVRPVWIRP